jgi:hypothetical protein
VTDREHLLALVEEFRAETTARLDALAAAIRQGMKSPSPASPKKRRAPVRPPIGGPVLITDDIARAKARAALERMGLVKVRR